MMHIFPHWYDRKNVSLTPGAAGYRCGRGHPVLDSRPSGVEERRVIQEATEEASLCTLHSGPGLYQLLLTDFSLL